MKKLPDTVDDLVVVECDSCGNLFSKYEMFEDEDGYMLCEWCYRERYGEELTWDDLEPEEQRAILDKMNDDEKNE